MGKRVYEIARELDLGTKEVISRLNDAGVEVKSHFAVVEDPIYERVFGDNSDAAPHGRSEALADQVLGREPQPQRKRSPNRTLLLYILLAALAFAVTAGIGAMGALMLRGDLGSPGADEAQPPQGGQKAPRSQDKAAAEGELGVQQAEDASHQREAEYVARVGDIQADAVETILDSHDKLARYDALTADDVEEMQANKDVLQQVVEQTEGLDPPQRYDGEHYEAFSSTIRELHRASELAYNLAADPTAATRSVFDEYAQHLSEAAAGLERSNEILGRDYKTIEDVRRVNSLS
jgi:hypothetical protein